MAQNITVGVRVRPLSQLEKGHGAWECIVCQEGSQINVNDPDDKVCRCHPSRARCARPAPRTSPLSGLLSPPQMGGIDYLRLDKTKDKSYAFDHVYDHKNSQEDVFDGTAKQLIPEIMRGANATCFAYGATGSGKTYTMMGSSDNPGVVLLTTDHLFDAIVKREEEDSIVVQAQYVEIYNEQIRDLIEPEHDHLDVREAPGKGTFVAGAAIVNVTSRREL
jgi:hypothetical protein